MVRTLLDGGQSLRCLWARGKTPRGESVRSRPHFLGVGHAQLYLTGLSAGINTSGYSIWQGWLCGAMGRRARQ